MIVALDESKFGNTHEEKGEWYCFYKITKRSKEFITKRKCFGELVAVTKTQYNQWKNEKIIAERKDK